MPLANNNYLKHNQVHVNKFFSYQFHFQNYFTLYNYSYDCIIKCVFQNLD